jgi:hypothetical protein
MIFRKKMAARRMKKVIVQNMKRKYYQGRYMRTEFQISYIVHSHIPHRSDAKQSLLKSTNKTKQTTRPKQQKTTQNESTSKGQNDKKLTMLILNNSTFKQDRMTRMWTYSILR